MAERIPIFGENGKYVSSFGTADARCVWEGRGWYSSSVGGAEHAYALYCLADAKYAWCDTTKGQSGEFTKGYLISAVEAVEHLHGLNAAPPDELLRDADGRRQNAKPRPNLLTVYDEGTNEPYQLDTEAGEKWVGEYGSDWNGFEGHFNWANVETLYRRKGWVLVHQQYHAECDFPDHATFRWLTDEQAAEWLVKYGHCVPDDIVQHVAERYLDSAEPAPRDYEAERQARMAESWRSWTEGMAADEQTEPSASEPPPTEAEVRMEIESPRMVAGHVPPAPATETELAALYSPSQLATRFGFRLTAFNKRLERWRRKNGDGWHEVENRKPREPRYLYRLCAVLPLINELLAESNEQSPSNEMSA